MFMVGALCGGSGWGGGLKYLSHPPGSFRNHSSVKGSDAGGSRQRPSVFAFSNTPRCLSFREHTPQKHLTPRDASRFIFALDCRYGSLCDHWTGHFDPSLVDHFAKFSVFSEFSRSDRLIVTPKLRVVKQRKDVGVPHPYRITTKLIVEFFPFSVLDIAPCPIEGGRGDDTPLPPPQLRGRRRDHNTDADLWRKRFRFKAG